MFNINAKAFVSIKYYIIVIFNKFYKLTNRIAIFIKIGTS